MAHPIALVAGAGLLALSLSLAGADVARAANGGGGNKPSTPTCSPGQVYDPATKSCKQQSGAIDDKTLYEQGRQLAIAGRYADALIVLDSVKDRHDSMLLTMTGYAKRKLGDFDAGMAYYQQALAIDPDNVNTREYLGEAYAEKGHLELARAELEKIEAVCGTECEQYVDLAAAIDGEPQEW